MNVLFKAEDGKLDRIDTYIGVEGNEFVCVGSESYDFLSMKRWSGPAL